MELIEEHARPLDATSWHERRGRLAGR